MILNQGSDTEASGHSRSFPGIADMRHNLLGGALPTAVGGHEHRDLLPATCDQYFLSIPPPPPGFNLSMGSYNRILRLMQHRIPVKLEVELESQFVDGNSHTSVVGEIRGATKAGEIVLAGAHLDSYHVGTGASDNAANCAVLMEAMRILKALKSPVARTVRIALWAGEERGARGSASYVKQWKAGGNETLYLYLNLDSGGGRVRGLQVQERLDLALTDERWPAPFKALGKGFVSVRTSGSSDQVSFEKEGLPAAVVLQDPLLRRTQESLPRKAPSRLATHDACGREQGECGTRSRVGRVLQHGSPCELAAPPKTGSSVSSKTSCCAAGAPPRRELRRRELAGKNRRQGDSPAARGKEEPGASCFQALLSVRPHHTISYCPGVTVMTIRR